MASNESIDSSIYSLTIFHRQTCVFHLNIVEAKATDYWRNFILRPSNKTESSDSKDNLKKFSVKKYYRQIRLLNGLLFSMKSFCRRLIPNITNNEEGFNSYTTPVYKLHLFETLSGHKFVLMVHPSIQYGNELLKRLYSTIYLDTVVKSPEYTYGNLLDNRFFEDSLGTFFKHFIQEMS